VEQEGDYSTWVLVSSQPPADIELGTEGIHLDRRWVHVEFPTRLQVRDNYVKGYLLRGDWATIQSASLGQETLNVEKRRPHITEEGLQEIRRFLEYVGLFNPAWEWK